MVDSFIFILKHTGETATGKFCGFYFANEDGKHRLVFVEAVVALTLASVKRVRTPEFRLKE